MTALQINQLVYDPGSLSLTWIGDGIVETTPFTVTLTPGSGQAQTFPATGFSAGIAVTLATNTSWTASVAPTAGGAASAPVPVLLVAPAVSRVQNMGSSLGVDWQQVTGISTYVAILSQRGHSSASKNVTGLTASFDVSMSGDGWSCAVRAATPDFVSFGPGTAYTPILAVPTLSLVSNSGSDLSLAWTAVPPYTTYYAALQAGSAAPQTQSVVATTATFEGQLAGSHTTWVCAQSTDRICIGPPSQTYQPITVSPTMTAVTYDGATLALSWTAAPGFPRSLALLQMRGSGSQQQSVRGASAAFSGPLTGVGNNKCLVSAQSEDQVNVGPPAAVYTVIVTAPQLQQFDYDSGAIAVQWTAASDPTISGNQLVVSGPGQPLQLPLGTSGSQTVAGTLTAGVAYGAVVRATNGIVTGPASEAVVPLTSAPGSLRLGFDGTHLRAIWTAAAGSGVSGYLAELSKNGASLESESSTALQQQFDSGLDSDALFTARTRATGTKVKGPWSAVATGPYRTTRTYAFDPLGRIRSVGWSSGAAEAYNFDSAGNLLSYARTAAPPPPSPSKRRK